MPQDPPKTVAEIKRDLAAHKSEADELRVYSGQDRERLQQAYEGGKYLTDPDNGWIKRFPGEEAAEWEERKTRLRGGINPCRNIPDKICSWLVNGTIQIECEDQAVQEAVEDHRKRNKWNELRRKKVEHLTSIYGTMTVGPWWDERTKSVQYRWHNVDTVYPVQSPHNAFLLDALFFAENSASAGEVVDIWTPLETARYVSGKPDEMGIQPNPYGTIPYATFVARESAKIGAYFGLSDIHEGSEALKVILDLVNAFSELVHMQGHSQGVIIGEQETNDIVVGPKRFIVIGETEGKGDFKFASPELDFPGWLEAIDKYVRYAYESESVPILTVRSDESPEAGVALKIRLKPLTELVKERRQRHREAEKHLFILTAMAHEINVNDKMFSMEEAADYMGRLDETTNVTYVDDYDPTDEWEEMGVLDAKDGMGLVTEYEKWLHLHPGASRDDWETWLKQKREDEETLKENQPQDMGLIVPVLAQAADGIEVETGGELDGSIETKKVDVGTIGGDSGNTKGGPGGRRVPR